MNPFANMIIPDFGVPGDPMGLVLSLQTYDLAAGVVGSENTGNCVNTTDCVNTGHCENTKSCHDTGVCVNPPEQPPTFACTTAC